MNALATDHDALLRAVLEAPEDNAPRLVFADWLEENGRAARAEFIRQQIGGGLRDRTSYVGDGAVFRGRGFVEEVHLPLADFMERAKDLFSRHPITKVRLTDRDPWDRGPPDDEIRFAWRLVFEHNAGRTGLPGGILAEMATLVYPTAEAAYRALSRACVRYGRKLAGLTPLEPGRP